MSAKHRKAARARFFAAHPRCCFCGGAKDAEQIDHVPPKCLFLNDNWPEGYEFPACGACNQGSSQIDQLVGLLSRLGSDTHYDSVEFLNLLSGVRNNMKDSEPTLPTPLEAEQIVRQLNIPLPAGARPEDAPLATISAETFRSLDVLFYKLTCAIHYLEVGTILPADGRYLRIAAPNQARFGENPLAWTHLPFIRNVPVIARQGKSLTEQFDYRWGHIERDGVTGISFHLRQNIFGVIAGPLPPSTEDKFPPERVMTVSAGKPEL